MTALCLFQSAKWQIKDNARIGKMSHGVDRNSGLFRVRQTASGNRTERQSQPGNAESAKSEKREFFKQSFRFVFYECVLQASGNGKFVG